MSDGDDGGYDIPRAKPPKGGDAKATKEGIGFASGRDIDSKKTDITISKMLREDAVQNHIHKLIVWFLYLTFTLVAICVIVLVLHFVLPENWLFLSSERVDTLRALLFSGGIGAGVTALANSKLLSNNNHN